MKCFREKKFSKVPFSLHLREFVDVSHNSILASLRSK